MPHPLGLTDEQLDAMHEYCKNEVMYDCITLLNKICGKLKHSETPESTRKIIASLHRDDPKEKRDVLLAYLQQLEGDEKVNGKF